MTNIIFKANEDHFYFKCCLRSDLKNIRIIKEWIELSHIENVYNCIFLKGIQWQKNLVRIQLNNSQTNIHSKK